jgi:hypothetical protein
MQRLILDTSSHGQGTYAAQHLPVSPGVKWIKWRT